MQKLKQGRKLIKFAAVGTAVGLAATNASAALPDGIASALTTAQTDAIAAIGLGGAMILAVGVIGVAWRVAAKYLRRASGSA